MTTAKLTILTFLLFSSLEFFAQNFIRDLNKEQKIEAQLEVINPKVLRIFKEGTIAMDQNNLKLSDSLYNIVYKEAPTFDPVIRRLGMLQLQLGNLQKGIELCEKAVAISKSAYNLLSLAYCYMSPGNSQNLTQALSLLKEAQMLPDGDDADILALIGQIALQENNINDFRSATNSLFKLYPNLMVTHYYGAILAAQDYEWKRAENEILLAKKLGLPEEDVQRFLDSGVSSILIRRQYGIYFLWIVGIWLLGLSILFLVGKLLSNITLRSIDKQPLSESPNNIARILRPIYRLFMNMGGIYYYLSLPIILLVAIALVVLLVYGIISEGEINQLIVLLAVGSIFTIYGLIRSLIIRVDFSDPGRILKKEEAPGLYNLVEEVAYAIDTRPIDEIRLTPTTDLAVYERGSWVEKFKDKSKRILILGVGVLKDFNQTDFKAILAHEYGHFTNRDTAGGEIALRVRNDMDKFFYSLYVAKQNVWWNLGFLFLRLYHFIFRRISHGSARLQEILADNVAAKTYGKLAFQNGLTYVIKREIEFNSYANQEIEDAKKSQRPFTNLYELSGSLNESIEEEFSKSLARKTTEDDTHPSPSDRFRFISNINIPNIPYNDSKIKDFFTNWDLITHEMTNLIEDQLNNNK